MKNTKNTYLLKKQTKKDKEIAKYRRRSRAFLTFFIIAAVVALVQIGQNMLQSSNSNSNSVIIKSYINQTLLNNTNNSSTATCQEPSLTSSIVNGIMLFMNKIFEYPGSFWTKFFIFLGVIYLIQVFFSLIFDVIELILLAFVVIKRLIVWIYRKITGKDKNEERLKKIAEL